MVRHTNILKKLLQGDTTAVVSRTAVVGTKLNFIICFCREILPRLEPELRWCVDMIMVVWRNCDRIPCFREPHAHFFVYAFVLPLSRSALVLSPSSIVARRLSLSCSSASAATPTTTKKPIVFYFCHHLGFRDNSKVISNPHLGSGRGENATEPFQIPHDLVHGLDNLLLGHRKKPHDPWRCRSCTPRRRSRPCRAQSCCRSWR